MKTAATLPLRHLPAALVGRSSYIVAKTGAGKTYLLDALAEHITSTGAGVVWRMSHCGVSAVDGADWEVDHFDPAQVKAMVTAARCIVDRRSRECASTAGREYTGPALHLLADDIYTVSDDLGGELARIAQIGRMVGVFVAATSQDAFTHRELRDRCSAHVIGALPASQRFVFEMSSYASRTPPAKRGEFDLCLNRSEEVITQYRPDAPEPSAALSREDLAAAGEHYAGRSQNTTAEEAA